MAACGRGRRRNLCRVGSVIFVTVGTQLAFDRLLDAMDALAEGLDEPVIAQTIATGAGRRWPHMEVRRQLDPAAFETLFAEARLVVGHAGIGTVLTAKRLRRPLIIVPRRHGLGEHRNDHQLATARHLAGRKGLYVAWDIAEIVGFLGETMRMGDAETPTPEHARLLAHLSKALLG